MLKLTNHSEIKNNIAHSSKVISVWKKLLNVTHDSPTHARELISVIIIVIRIEDKTGSL